ncbi:MAG: class I SAM-dependent methyltransferase [Burkholderiales bacterium]|nr:class I SAM-dependent methyltransferase [Burkholderiales bacterium]
MFAPAKAEPVVASTKRWDGESDDDYGYRLACQSISSEQWPQGDPFGLFVELSEKFDRPRILELGTRRALAELSTRHQRHFPHAGEYLGTDIEHGPDVDFVADVHRLSQTTGEEAFDAILTESGFEHFKYPHLAAHEIMKALRVNGLVFVQTHQTFPIHAVPYDYCRFSTDALRSLFGRAMGMEVIASAYASPAAIYSRVDPLGRRFPAFLHVNVLARKVAATPACYEFEFDCDFPGESLAAQLSGKRMRSL